MASITKLLPKLPSIHEKMVFWLILITVFLLPFETHPRWTVGGYHIRLSQLAGLALIIVASPIVVRSIKKWFSLPWLLLLFFLGISIVSSVVATHQIVALTTTIFYGFDFMLAFTIATLWRAYYRRLIITAILVSGGLVGLFSLWQLIGDFAGVSRSLTLLDLRYTKIIFGYPRIQGFSLEPLYFANYLFIPFGISLGGVIESKDVRWVLPFVFFTTIITLTFARGALLAAVVVLMIGGVIVLIRKDFKRLGILIISVLVAAVLAFGMIKAGARYAAPISPSDLNSTELLSSIPQTGIDSNVVGNNLGKQFSNISDDTSAQSRLDSWRKVWPAFRSDPIIGIGPGNAKYWLYDQYSADKKPDRLPIVNNEPLELLTETGVLGLVAILAFIVFILTKAWQAWRATKDSNIRAWQIGLILMVVAFGIQYMFFSTLYITHIWVMIGFLIASLVQQKSAKKISS